MYKIYPILKFLGLFALLHLNLWCMFNTVGLKRANVSKTRPRGHYYFTILERNSTIYENFGLTLMGCYYFCYCHVFMPETVVQQPPTNRYFGLGRRNANTQITADYFRRKFFDYGWLCLIPYVEAYVLYGLKQYFDVFKFLLENYKQPADGFALMSGILIFFHALSAYFCACIVWLICNDFDCLLAQRLHWFDWINEHMVHMNVVFRRPRGQWQLWNGRDIHFRFMDMSSGDPLPAQLRLPVPGQNHFGSGDGWWVQ